MIQKVWMVNDVGGAVDINEGYLYIRFSHSRNKCFKIDAVTLLRQLNTQKGEFTLGELTFIPVTSQSGEKLITILAEQSKSDKDQAVVYCNELKECLYCLIG